jgi:hypothetical protein
MQSNWAYAYYADSNYSLLVDGRMLYEQQRKDFGADPWPNGLTANRAILSDSSPIRTISG